MIIDDPIKNRQDADSITYRNRIWAEWGDSFKSRLSAGAKVIIIQTRWHIDDFAGRIIKNEKNVEVINLPCEAQENDILGRKKGDSLFPEIGKDNKWLIDFKQGFIGKEGTRTWNALFQGKPSVESGNIIKRQWIKYYDKLPEIVQTVMSVDATFKEKEDSDFVAIQVWGKSGADMYLIDRIHERMGFVDTVKAILSLKQKHNKISQIFVEDKANGSAIIEVLRRKIAGVIAINPERRKSRKI